MADFKLPVRKYNSDPDLRIPITTEKTAFLVVDSYETGFHNEIIECQIHLSLNVARNMGLKVVYLYDAISGVGGPYDVTTRIHGLDHQDNSWKPVTSTFNPLIRPLENEPVIPKWGKDGFDGTPLDYYLKTWNIDTIIAVGFHIKSCLYQTCLSARHHNYRVVMLRDCTNSFEFPDTEDVNNPEGGWLRFVFLRMYETDIGYTSTSTDLQKVFLDGQLESSKRR
ncbi:isochorismatase family protein [Alicyclobacillus fodiniaquatilis]|uniref:Isochorismatase family protein n=1 Tax=Alicyclobacillus fodiniaquatilis TaxID=1661150 RepID=A0ABW4JFU6_9BACL